MGTPDGSDAALAAPDTEQDAAWRAVRTRLAIDAPWLTAALFRAVPVAVPQLPGDRLVTADRWGRLYVDFTAETRVGIAAVAAAAQTAVLDWVSGRADTEPWMAHRLDDRFPSVSATDTARAGRRVAAGLLTQTRPRFGTDPLERWREWATQTAGAPQITWAEHLGAQVRAAVSTRSGFTGRSYARPSRRQLPGVLLPARVAPRLDVAVVADKSGSIANDLPTLIAETSRVATAVGLHGGTVTVYPCDDEVDGAARMPGADLDLTPRPGHTTDLRPGIAAATAAAPRPGVVVVLTDGLTPWPTSPPPATVIVVLVGQSTITAQARENVPPWATTLTITT